MFFKLSNKYSSDSPPKIDKQAKFQTQHNSLWYKGNTLQVQAY